jgi:hypothetical protein
MKYLLTLILVQSFNCAFPQNMQDSLTNESIVKLSNAGLSESVIIQKINSSICKFDVSTDALLKLKSDKVSDGIIGIMIQKQNLNSTATPNRSSVTTISNNSTKEVKEADIPLPSAGIFYQTNGLNYILLNPTPAVSTNHTSMITNTTSNLIEINKAHSENVINNSKPVFYFNLQNNSLYFADDRDKNLTYLKKGDTWQTPFINPGSPSQFAILKLDVSGSKRRFLLSKSYFYVAKTKSVVSENSIKGFKIDKLSASDYKITFDQNLEKGEYCFILLVTRFTGTETDIGLKDFCGWPRNFKVYDFSIN